MKTDIKGKVCVVTGAGKGIGKSIAMSFAAEGAKTVIADIDEQAGMRTVSELLSCGAEAFFVKANVQDLPSMQEAARLTSDHFGPADILVINAGISELVGFEEISLDSWERVLRINLTGSFVSAKAFLPGMIEKQAGNIIFVSSGSAFTGGGGGAHYSSSKAGQHGLMRSLARQYGEQGIRVNAIAPRTIETDILQTLYPPGTEGRKALTGKIPVRRVGMPADVANMALFLASNLSSYVHGQIMLVDGGRTYSG